MDECTCYTHHPVVFFFLRPYLCFFFLLSIPGYMCTSIFSNIIKINMRVEMSNWMTKEVIAVNHATVKNHRI